MLDVLITISESTPRKFVSKCKRTVRLAADLAQYPVHIIEVPGVPGHIGRAMLSGLAKSRAEYVAWVDDDDIVLPNAFACLERHFPARPTAICAREIQLLANGMLLPVNRRHHLTAFHRDIVDTIDLKKYPAQPNIPIHKAAHDGAVDELSWVYIWRRRLSPGMNLRSNMSAAEREIL